MPSELTPAGDLAVRRLPPLRRPVVRSVADAVRYGGEIEYSGLTKNIPGHLRRPDVLWRKANQENFIRSRETQAWADQARRRGALTALGHLWLAKVDTRGERLDLGLAGCRMVTTAGANFIVDAFQNLVELDAMRWHGLGTSSVVEAVSNVALGAELTTQYVVNNTRSAGTLGEQAGSPNIYETTALVTVDAAVTVTEHGLFSRAAIGGGTLLDRTVFAGVPLAAGESLQCTYQFTLNAGG